MTTGYSTRYMSTALNSTVTLRIRTAASYEIFAGSPAQVVAHLIRQGWQQYPGNTEHEVARLRDADGGLVVLYRASVLVQGQQQRGHAALAKLLEVAV